MMEQSAKRAGRQARNPSNQEQDAKRAGRQAPEPQPEPGKDDGTGCQKSRETSPGTLAGRERMMEQDAKRV